MRDQLGRRDVLKGVIALAAAMTGAVAQADTEAPKGLHFGSVAPFSFEILKAHARELAGGPYTPPPELDAALAKLMNYDEMGRVKHRFADAVFGDGPGPFKIEMINVGIFNRTGVKFFVVDHGGARELLYDPSYFDFPLDSPFGKVPDSIGFGGFRIHEAHIGETEWMKKVPWAVFQGASYFRTVGELGEMGISARGIALNVAVVDRPEEFPDFKNFFVEPGPDGESITVYALLEGPSIVGAYRFVMHRTKSVIMDVDCTLFVRAAVSRFGIAPLTSMYWFSETKKETAIDWRPEVHDSDGLEMWTGSGERLWRALNNPPYIIVSAFSDNNPRGFGMMQRDRVFDHYLDGVNYDRRPSLWVEPLPGPQGEGWGKGAVQLCEIPTDDEIHDNAVAMWVPEKPVPAGAELTLAYRLYWVADGPFPHKLGRVVATRLGRGGQPGQPRPKGVRKFMVEFLGGPLVDLAYGVVPEMVVTTSRGSLKGYHLVEAAPDGVPGHWRAQFDLTVYGTEPVELRGYMQSGGQTLTETWMFQYHPF
jgi:glucans biosynthesis protein